MAVEAAIRQHKHAHPSLRQIAPVGAGHLRRAKYAAQKVKVTGTYDEKSKTINVASIEPLESN